VQLIGSAPASFEVRAPQTPPAKHAHARVRVAVPRQGAATTVPTRL